MLMLASKGALFIGQGVAYDGVSMYSDLEGVPAEQRIEFPVAEELNIGYATGLAMMGYLPVVVLPRMDFLMRAMDQLVNHLDKIPAMSRGQWQPKVIIRTRVGGRTPLDAGPQHTQNHVKALRQMLTSVGVFEVTRPEDAMSYYQIALARSWSSIVVEAF